MTRERARRSARIRARALALFLAAPALTGAQSLPWEPSADLKSVATVGGHFGTYLASSYCLDGCRYDRTSVDPGAGGRRFVRIDPTPDGDEAVLLDQPGAGAVTRLWMTTGSGVSQSLPDDVRLRVYFDGEDMPTIDAPLADFFGDAPLRPNDRRLADGFSSRERAAPLESSRRVNSGGNVSYLPLPYAHGIRIALLNGADRRLWYQINYAQVADATSVTSFVDESAYADLAGLLSAPETTDRAIATARPFGRDPRVVRMTLPDAATALVSPGIPAVLFDRDGAGWLRALHIQVDAARWDDLRIALRFDGETTADLPIARFFGADSADTISPRGIFAGVDARRAFYSMLPMPFRRDARVVVYARDGIDPHAAPIELHWRFDDDDESPPANAGTFGVSTHAACPTDPATAHDEVLFHHEGSGRLVGLVAWMSGDGTRSGGYYLEGDERIYIDGSVQPMWYGTGVEDAFNGGFYFDAGAYAGPLAGAPLRHAGTVDDATSMYRWFLTDAPVWRTSISYALENGALGDEPLCIEAVAYFYAQSTASQSIVASLALGDAASETAAHYVHGADALCDTQTARFGDEPPTSTTAVVCRGTQPSRFAFAGTRAPARYFRLRRTFDAGVDGQAADVYVNGAKVGAWGDVQANPTRRWSQMDIDFRTDVPATQLAFEIRPRPGRTVTESRYELWSDVPANVLTPSSRVRDARRDDDPPR